MEQNLRQRADKWSTDGSAMRVDAGEEWISSYNVYELLRWPMLMLWLCVRPVRSSDAHRIKYRSIPIIDKKSKRMKFPLSFSLYRFSRMREFPNQTEWWWDVKDAEQNRGWWWWWCCAGMQGHDASALGKKRIFLFDIFLLLLKYKITV